MHPRWVYGLLVYLGVMVCVVWGRLLDDVLIGCDPSTMPAVPGGGPLKVTISIALREIIRLDAKSQILTTSIWFRTHWVDPALTWNPEDYNGTSKIHVPHSRIWKPDLMLFDNTDLQYRPMLQDVMAVASHNGSVSFIYPVIFKTTCIFDIYYFPFDQQECFLRIGSWTYDKATLWLQLDTMFATDVRFFKRNSEWSLVNITASLMEYFQLDYHDPGSVIHDIDVSVKMRRRSIMQIYYLYFPNALINVIATFQFLLPCDSAEKITLGITILLAMIVYLLLMAEMLPMTDVVPNIVQYMTMTLTLVTISLVITIIVLQVHHNGKHDNHSQLPPWARRWLLHGLARLLCMHQYITSDDEHLGKLMAQTSHISLISDDGAATASAQPENSMDRGLNQDQQISITGALKPSGPTQDQTRRTSLMGGYAPTVSPIPSSTSQGTRKHSVQLKRSELSKNKELLLVKILKHCEDFTERATNWERDQELASEWQQLAMLLDRLFFYIYCVVTVLVWIFIFANRPGYSDEIVV